MYLREGSIQEPVLIARVWHPTPEIISTPLCHVVVSPRGFLAFFLGKYLLRHFWALENLIADIKEFHDNFKLGLALTLNCIFHYDAAISGTLRWFLLMWFKVNFKLNKSHKQKMKTFGILASNTIFVSVKTANDLNFICTIII